MMVVEHFAPKAEQKLLSVYQAAPILGVTECALRAMIFRGTVATSNGVTQITYHGSPLYTFKGAKALTTSGNGVGGVWHVIKMSESNIVGGAS